MIKIFVFLTLFMISFSQVYFEHVLILNDGQKIEGQILKQNEFIELKTIYGSILKIHTDSISSITVSQSKRLSKQRISNPINSLKLKSFYIYFSFGASSISLGNKTDKLISDFSLANDPNRSQYAMDFVNHYWPIRADALLGVAFNASIDVYEFKDRLRDKTVTIQNNYISYSISYIKFLNHFGDGFFYRIDAGLATLGQVTPKDKFKYSSPGATFVLGGGYAVPFNTTPILINSNFALYPFGDGQSVSAFQFNIGILL